jgi:hypothetical protein
MWRSLGSDGLFERRQPFAIETAAFPPSLAWSAPLLVDSFTTAASLVILWRYLRGEAGGRPGMPGAWSAAPPLCGRPQRRPRPDRDPTATAVARPQLPAPDHTAAAGNGSGPPRDSRTRVRELVARERATGIRLNARDVATAAGISERRAYELLRAVRAEAQQP